ncbi:aspartyl-tRNA synthetase [Myriangium duriaei CBS 260.36]|uniref:aspartate--tRNA ligase n=1 Tax=Myriangium duriaei CBS 260.36 TaxID=1168546 RepID=A0A9P4J3V3_9PEZI|nr:aspartyl-tRNA synthetase [Myriangium duriaei CBS 260.36]
MERALSVLKRHSVRRSKSPTTHPDDSAGHSSTSLPGSKRNSLHLHTNGRAESPGASNKPSNTASPAVSVRHERHSHDDSSRKRLSTHSPIRAIQNVLGRRSSSSSSDRPLNRDGEPMTKGQQRKFERAQSKEHHKKAAEEREAADRQRQKEAEERAAASETEEQKTKYGILPVNNYAGESTGEKRIELMELSVKDVGQMVTFRARIQNIRKISNKLVFLELRQQAVTIQGVLHEHGSVSQHMIYWTGHLHNECVVRVRAIVQEPKAEQGEVHGASIKNIEVSVHELHVEGRPTEHLPFTVAEAEVTAAEEEQDGRHKLSDRARQANRVLDLRTTASQSIFRVQSAVSTLFREALLKQDFIEIHTPKLQAGASESGASVFKLEYFGRPAALAQSPQLGKQMAISADFRRVFEIGAVFRAENSNTHRHMTEYTGLDLEMAIDEHYHEVVRVLDVVFKTIFRGIYERCRAEIDILKKHFPHEDLVIADQTPIIKFSDGIKWLNESGWRNDKGEELPEDEDLGTRDEIQLGKLVREKYNTDYYILDKFPTSARPFYAMPDPYNENVTNSFDIFCRGQEILSGGQRIHDAALLKKNLDKLRIDTGSMEEYLNGFEWGMPPHGGGGIGLERLLMLMLNLGDIRNASMFPRDPKSFPLKPKVPQLRHPEASTLHPPWEGQDRALAKIDLQPLEKLIANYGDASNTSWLEPRTEIWRAGDTGAAVGFVPQGDYAITVGDPLCHPEQYIKTIGEYLRFIKKEKGLKPLWVLGGHAVEEVLATKHDWRTFSVAAEQRLDPSHNKAANDGDVQKKIRHAQKEGVKIHDYPIGKEIPDDVKQKVDARVEDWIKGRKGKQVHLTEIRPWQDMEHRQYHFAYDKEGVLCALTIMAQLSPEHGWQVKYSLDFPNATSGAIEMVVMHALKAVADEGATSVTFGGGATSSFTPGHNLKGAKVKVLSKAYHAIAAELKLTQKTEFREKLGAEEDPVYVCYPPRGMGPSGVRAILAFFGDD